MDKPLPPAITSYDLLKTFAVVIMLVDHIGYYFFPDDMWWRAVGRIGFPVWFFLTGYAQSRALPDRLWIGAFFLLGMNVVVGMSVLPLNALFTIIFLRLILTPVTQAIGRRADMLWFILVMSLVLLIPSGTAVEYGTQALLFAVFGYMVRNRAGVPVSGAQAGLFVAAICAGFIALQTYGFNFTLNQFGVMAAGTIAVCMVLSVFRGVEYPALSARLPALVAEGLRFCGRRTLEIYVVHLTAFKIAALLMGAEGFSFLAVRAVY